MTIFKLPTELAEHLEQEIHTKLVKAVEDQAKGFNEMWAEREDGSQEVAEAALIPMLVKAIQELSAEIETLKSGG